MDDNSIAALAVVCIFGLPIAGWILIRFMQHSERMAMIKRGIVPPPGNAQKFVDAAASKWASQQMVPGPQGFNFEAQAQLRKGITTAFIGLALLIGLSFIGYRGDGSFSPGPWLLGGLIPMFVGVAQIITAVLSGAQLPGTRTYVPPGNPYGAPPPPPPQPPSAPPPGGAYTYRPPGTQEELPRTKPPQQQ